VPDGAFCAGGAGSLNEAGPCAFAGRALVVGPLHRVGDGGQEVLGDAPCGGVAVERGRGGGVGRQVVQEGS
jgi:hypothetical protein